MTARPLAGLRVVEETKGKSVPAGLPDGKTAEVVEALASQPSKFLAGAFSYMFEAAADTEGGSVPRRSHKLVRVRTRRQDAPQSR